MKPNLKEEKRLWKQGYGLVGGIDEVGRGPLAGPVVACCFCILDPIRFKLKAEIKDSKQLTEKQREIIFSALKNQEYAKWGIGRVSEKVIDKINILQATKLAMNKAVKDLQKRISLNYLLIDGNFSINNEIFQKSIIRGDQKILSIAVASIIAKVTRDRLMAGYYHKKYPQYCFDKHKGYGTILHRQKIAKYGFCKIHRRSFSLKSIDFFVK